MNRSRVTADLASHGNIFVDIANDRVGIGSTIPTHKVDLDGSFKLHDGSGYNNHITYTQNPPTITFPTGPLANLSKTPTLVFGDRTSGGDLKIYQDFYSLHIRHLGPSGFHIGSQASHIAISGSNGSNAVQTSIRIDAGANEGVKLYSGGTQRFETVGYGVTVLGTTETQELNVTGVSTFSGNVKIDAGANTTLDVVADSAGVAMVRTTGASGDQTTAAFELVQSTSSVQGGGISYNGDGSPSFVSGETADHVTFYRILNGTRSEVFSYPYNSNNVVFNGTVTASSFSGSLGANNLTGTIPSSVQSNITQIGTLGSLSVSGGTNPVSFTHTGGNCVLFNRSGKTVSINANYAAGGSFSDIGLTSGMDLKFSLGGAHKIVFKSAGHIEPETDSQINLGSTTKRFANVYSDHISLAGVSTAIRYDVNFVNAEIKLTTNQSSFSRYGRINHYHNNGTTEHNAIQFSPRNGATGRMMFYNQVGGTVTERLRIDGTDGIQPSAHIIPMTDSTYNLGSNGTRFANVYTDNLDVSGNLFVADSILHTGDTNTKIRFPAADTISFETASYERFRITSDGRFGFNTTNPDSNFRMDLAGSLRVGTGSYGSRIQFSRSGLGDELVIGVDGYGNSTTNEATIQSSINSPRPLVFATNNTERLRIASNGGVGISTDKIHRNHFLHIAAPSQDYSNTSTQLPDGGGIMLQHTDTLASTNRTYPGIFWTGNTASLGRVRAGILGVTASNNDATHIVFLTRHAANGTSFFPSDERMRITDQGLVGIKTKTPIGTLDIYDGTLVLSKPNASGGERNWRFVNNNVAAGNLGLQVSTAAGGSSFSNVIEITRTGRVGIGEGSPDFDLHIKSDNPGIVLEDSTGSSQHGQAIIEQNGDNLKIRQDAGNASSGTGSNIRFEIDGGEKTRITSEGFIHLGTNFHLNKVGGQAVTGQDFDPIFKIYNNTSSKWLMHLRNDNSTAPNGIFMRAGNASTNYSMYITGGDEHSPHIVARGDSRVGIGTSNPRTNLHVEGSINGGTINTPFQRFFDKSNNLQRASKHYFRCIKGAGSGTSRDFDIVTVDLNQNFHQAICKVFYGTRLQGVSDSTTQVNEIIFGINRFIGNNPTRNRQVIHQDTNSANHADIDVVIMSSTQYRVRLTFSSSLNGSSFAGGYVELIGVGSGGDGAFYSMSHSHGINV